MPLFFIVMSDTAMPDCMQHEYAISGSTAFHVRFGCILTVETKKTGGKKK
jgi:hypothetical protein